MSYTFYNDNGENQHAKYNMFERRYYIYFLPVFLNRKTKMATILQISNLDQTEYVRKSLSPLKTSCFVSNVSTNRKSQYQAGTNYSYMYLINLTANI